jgi:hypothetical protein
MPSTLDIEQNRYEELLPVDLKRHREILKKYRDGVNQTPFWQEEPWKPSFLSQVHRWVRVKEPEIKLKDSQKNLYEWVFPLEPHGNFDEESLLEWSENYTMPEAELTVDSEEYKFRIEKVVETSEAEMIKDSVSEAFERTWHPASSIQEIL